MGNESYFEIYQHLQHDKWHYYQQKSANRGFITSEQLNTLSETSKYGVEVTAEMMIKAEISMIANQLNSRIITEFLSGQINEKSSSRFQLYCSTVLKTKMIRIKN